METEGGRLRVILGNGRARSNSDQFEGADGANEAFIGTVKTVASFQ